MSTETLWCQFNWYHGYFMLVQMTQKYHTNNHCHLTRLREIILYVGSCNLNLKCVNAQRSPSPQPWVLALHLCHIYCYCRYYLVNSIQCKGRVLAIVIKEHVMIHTSGMHPYFPRSKPWLPALAPSASAHLMLLLSRLQTACLEIHSVPAAHTSP